MNQGLKKYIEDALKTGSGLEDIHKALVDAGWDQAEVTAATRTIPNTTAAKLPHASRHATSGAVVFILTTLFILIVAAGAAAYFIINKKSPPQQQTTTLAQPTPPAPASSPTPIPSPSATNPTSVAATQQCSPPLIINGFTLDNVSSENMGPTFGNINGTVIRYANLNTHNTPPIENEEWVIIYINETSDNPDAKTFIDFLELPDGMECTVGGIQGRCQSSPWDFSGSSPSPTGEIPWATKGGLAFSFHTGNNIVLVNYELSARPVWDEIGKPINPKPQLPEYETSLRPFLEGLRCYFATQQSSIGNQPAPTGQPQPSPVATVGADDASDIETLLQKNNISVKIPSGFTSKEVNASFNSKNVGSLAQLKYGQDENLSITYTHEPNGTMIRVIKDIALQLIQHESQLVGKTQSEISGGNDLTLGEFPADSRLAWAHTVNSTNCLITSVAFDQNNVRRHTIQIFPENDSTVLWEFIMKYEVKNNEIMSLAEKTIQCLAPGDSQ